jgi:hypothetical protein
VNSHTLTRSTEQVGGALDDPLDTRRSSRVGAQQPEGPLVAHQPNQELAALAAVRLSVGQ